METDVSLVRIAENQSTFREANSGIESVADDLQIRDRAVPFICECARPDCTLIVRIRLAEYQAVRAHPTRFVTAVGHEDVSVESGAGRVVEARDAYMVLEKVGVAGEVARDRADTS